MDDYALDLGGKRYISSKRAAEITGYTKDYIGQLARGGKIVAKLVGRNWYIDEESIRSHKAGGDSRRSKTEMERVQREREERILNESGISFEKDPNFDVEYTTDSTPLMPQVHKADQTQEIHNTVAEEKSPIVEEATQVSDKEERKSSVATGELGVAINKTMPQSKAPMRQPANSTSASLDGVKKEETSSATPLQTHNSNTPPPKERERYTKELSPVLGALAASVLLLIGIATIFLQQEVRYSQERLDLIGDVDPEIQYQVGNFAESVLSAAAKLSDF